MREKKTKKNKEKTWKGSGRCNVPRTVSVGLGQEAMTTALWGSTMLPHVSKAQKS